MVTGTEDWSGSRGWRRVETSVDAASEEGNLPSGVRCVLLSNWLGEAAAGGDRGTQAPLAPGHRRMLLWCASPRLQETSPVACGVFQRVGGG